MYKYFFYAHISNHYNIEMTELKRNQLKTDKKIYCYMFVGIWRQFHFKLDIKVPIIVTLTNYINSTYGYII